MRIKTITERKELANARIEAGVECMFITADTETPVKMNQYKTTGRKVPSPKTG